MQSSKSGPALATGGVMYCDCLPSANPIQTPKQYGSSKGNGESSTLCSFGLLHPLNMQLCMHSTASIFLKTGE